MGDIDTEKVAENRGAKRGDPLPANEAARTRPGWGLGDPGPAERQAGRSAYVSWRCYSRDRKPSGVPRQSMIGIDTNVLVRYWVQDDARQAAAAAWLETRITSEHPGYVSAVVLAELAWVLERAYGEPNQRIAAAITALLAAEQLVVEHEREAFIATRGSRRSHCGRRRREKSAKFRRADRPRQAKRRGPGRAGAMGSPALPSVKRVGRRSRPGSRASH